MTHEETTLRTKKKLSAALKQLMQHKALSKITVTELIKVCNINRKTFYYHFEDIYSLLTWTLEQEAFEVVKQFNLLADYQDAFLFAIDYVEKNSFFLNCMYDSIGREEAKRFFYHDFIGIIQTYITDVQQELSLTVPSDVVDFLCEFYTDGLAGMIINVFQHPNQYDRDKLLENFSLVLRASIPAALKIAAI